MPNHNTRESGNENRSCSPMRRGDKIMTLEELRQKQIDLVGFNCYDENDCLEAVKQDGHALRYVKEQTPEICLAAVKQDESALQFVKEQTPEICLEAIKQTGFALQFVNSNILPLIADKL